MVDNPAKTALQNDVRVRDALSASQVDAFISGLDRFLLASLEGIIGDIETGAENADEAIAALATLEASLEELGLAEQLSGIQEIYKEELRQVRDYFRDLTGEQVLTNVDATIAETLIDFDFDVIDNTVGAYLDGLRSQVLRQVVSGVPTNVREIHAELGARTLRNIETELNTGLMGFNRTISVKKGVDAFGENPRFIYIGPLDKVTRDFCEGLLIDRSPAIYSLNEILALDNEQGLDVIAFGGGWNCRHQWRAVSPELEASLQ